MTKITSFKLNKKKKEPEKKPTHSRVKGSSLNARAVGIEVKATVEKGGKVVLGKIIKKHGYSDAIASNPSKVTKQTAFKEVVDPFVAKMMKRRDAAVKLLATREKRANYNHLIDGIDKLTKNIQLLTGKDTERRSDVREYMEALNKLMADRMKNK